MKNLKPEDMSDCKFIGVLLMTAKLLEQIRADVALPTEQAAMTAAKGYESLMRTAMRMYPGAGQMEAEIVAFAKRIGIEIEQKYVTPGSKVQQ